MLILTEKPSVAQSFAVALSIPFNPKSGCYSSDSIQITNCVGHLYELAKPEDYDESLKFWSFENISYTYFTEILNENFNIKISRTKVKSILNSLNYYTPIKHNGKKNKSSHFFRERKEHFGELVQADGTPYDWFGNCKSYCIQGFVDDATGFPVGLYMTKNECLLGYIEAFRNMSYEEGIPMQMYPDKAGIFFVNRKTKDDKKHFTQFGYMMENLGVDMFPAHSPQAKGRIERFWQTIQHRLPNLFRLKGIKTVEEANIFLRDEFPKIYKKWFPVKPKSEESFFVKPEKQEINKILKAIFPGTVDKSGVFLLKGYRFFCPEVMKDLIERTFLKNAKPKFREVYYDIDDIVLSDIKPKKKIA